MKQYLFLLFILFGSNFSFAQNLVTYAGGIGNERFNDVMQLSNGHFIVLGNADDLSWVNVSVPKIILTVPASATINNNTGTNKIGFIAEFSADLQTMLSVYYLPVNTVEDFRFVKTNSIPNTPTGNLYISGNLSNANAGGYFIGRLDNNFVSGAPSGFSWIKSINAKAGSTIKTYMPWDVGGNNNIVYATGDSHDYNWSAVYSIDGNGNDLIVPNWRIHWKTIGGEYYGDANSYPGGLAGLLYSGIVFKRDATRCELRSTNLADYNLVQPDENGGSKKGKWPMDVCFDTPCNPGALGNTTNGPGYTGYSPAATFTYGMSNVCIDRRTNTMYIGFNFKTTLPISGLPDFEPAVMVMDSTGDMLWWTRLYHEMQPVTNALTNSTPDQYIDAIAIDYSKPLPNGEFIIGARNHGNNTENFWEGNTIAANPTAIGFQKQFTGSSGNNHLSWIGRFSMSTKQILNSTYMAEYAEGATGLGNPHPDPNLDGWPDPNDGWPTLNTTYLAKNNIKVTADGSIFILGKGRRTITTANAFQKMVKPANGGLSCWNDFARVYKNDLSVPLYSSLLVGNWDTLTQANGDNVRLMGSWKTANGIVVVGYHTGLPNEMPIASVPSWGNSNYNGESAVLANLTAANITNPGDGPSVVTASHSEFKSTFNIEIYPNPTNTNILVKTKNNNTKDIEIVNLLGHTLIHQTTKDANFRIDLSQLVAGCYFITISTSNDISIHKIIKQ